MFTSAALYFGHDGGESIPPQWLERAQQLFTEYNQSPIQFTAADGGFAVDEFYVLADKGGEIMRFGETLPARRAELILEIQKGTISSLFLDSPDNSFDVQGRSRVRVSVSSTTIYLGAQEEIIAKISDAIKQAYRLSEGLFNVGYGIGYRMPLEQQPDCYASGFVQSKLTNPRDIISEMRTRHLHKKLPDDLWRDERNGQQRYLSGLFRGAYPASILSEAHLHSAALTSHGIGKLSELDRSRGLWLWELSDAEIPEAQKMLETRGILVSQAQS
jgi:hypothetical protein